MEESDPLHSLQKILFFVTIQVRTDEDFTGIADSVPYAGGRGGGGNPLPHGSEKTCVLGSG